MVTTFLNVIIEVVMMINSTNNKMHQKNHWEKEVGDDVVLHITTIYHNLDAT
jgi:hypothetical protein